MVNTEKLYLISDIDSRHKFPKQQNLDEAQFSQQTVRAWH